jgi:hypothetical protein
MITRWFPRKSAPCDNETPGEVRTLSGPLPPADWERAMEMWIFLIFLAVFSLIKRLPEDRRREMLLRIEYELYKRGFIEYRD